VPLFDHSLAEPTRPTSAESDEFLRFRAAERHLHWALAIPFTVCYVTAVVLVFVYNPNPARPWRMVFSWIHRLSGVALTTLPPFMIVRHWREFRMHLYNIRQGWTWRLDDVKWLFLMGPATFSSRISLPHQGKFNAGEKINFISVMSTYPMYIVTGLLIWFSSAPLLPWLVHFSMALLATPLVLGHIFMATINPDTRVGLKGMLSGFVDREWARHHYRLWYDEHFGHAVEAPPAQSAERRPAPLPFRRPSRLPGQPAITGIRPREGSDALAKDTAVSRVETIEDLPVILQPDDSDGILDEVKAALRDSRQDGVAGAELAS
jgi:formate dehydrogenase subunit gamma